MVSVHDMSLASDADDGARVHAEDHFFAQTD
jgi:hypothetical protein